MGLREVKQPKIMVVIFTSLFTTFAKSHDFLLHYKNCVALLIVLRTAGLNK